MNIACITQVRDECDIIELFVRINSRVFDHIYIIDNNSADATPLILKKLQLEGYPITVTFDGDNTYNQDGLITKALYSVNSLGLYDYFMFLDADEFLDETKEDILAKLESFPAPLLPKAMWRSWVPIDVDYKDWSAPLYCVFRPLAKENHVTEKVIVDKFRAPYIKMAHGNHDCLNKDGQKLPSRYCGIRINHFPIRSVEQIVSKAVLGNYRQMIRVATKLEKNVEAELGPVRNFFQLKTIHTELRNSNFVVTKEDLRRWAVCYNTELPPTGKDQQIDSAIMTEHFGDKDQDHIKYADLSDVSLGASFDKQMDIMHGVIKKLIRKLQEFGVMKP